MPTATQIADWIVRFRHDDLAAPVDPMSLEKLTYYAQAFRLAMTGKPLFDDEIRAWRHGPVIRAVYDIYREHGAQPIIPTPGVVSVEQELADFLSEVATFFGSYTAPQLSKASHAEEPWIRARGSFQRHDESDTAMPIEHIRSYYSSLMADGEEGLSRHELLDVVPEPRWAHLYVAGISVRRMRSHPLYSATLAKKLSETVPRLDDLPADLYAPIGKPNFIEFEDLAS
jgi:uncharacterized phage-associated protein